MLKESRTLLVLTGCVVLLGAISCLDEEKASSAASREVTGEGTGSVVTQPSTQGDVEMEMESPSISNLEGQTITAGDGMELTVISVTTAASETVKHTGMTAIEGGVASLSGEGSGFVLNCVSQIL